MSQPAITRVSNLQVSPSSTNKNNGLYAPSLTAAQIAAIPAAANGGIVYNSTAGNFQIRQGAAWANITTAPAATLTAPSLATIARPAAANGLIYYDTTTNKLTTAENAAYVAVFTTPEAQGGNLVVQSHAADQAPAVNGEVFYDTTLNTAKLRINGVWNNINTSVATTSGVGLVAGSTPFIFPAGPRGAVEVAANQVNGFSYTDTANANVLRSYVGGAWATVTVV